MENIIFSIEVDTDISEKLKQELQTATGNEVVTARKNNLDGSLETILQIVQIISSIAVTITPIVSYYINKKKVKKVKFGDIEIENPTKEQFETIWEQYLSQKSGEE